MPESNRPGPTVRSRAALVAAGVVLAAAALEMLARLTMPAPLPWRHPQLRYRSDPHLFFALQPNQQAFSADKPVLVNERGLRGPIVPYAHAGRRPRLLLLGDSIVFGFGVTDQDVLSARIAQHLEGAGIPVEVINTAVPAYTTEQEVRYMEGEGVRYAPDWVIVGVCWNDIAEKSGAQVSADGWLITPGSDQRPPAPHEGEFALAYELRNLLKQSRLLYASLRGWRALQGALADGGQPRFLSMRAAVLEGRDTAEVAEGWAQLEAALDRLQRLSAVHGFRLLLVPYPIPLTLERPFPHSTYPARLRSYATRAGIPMIDLDPVFRRAFSGHDSLFIPYDGDHPNAAGHDLAARAVADFLAAALRPSDAPPVQSAAASPPGR